MQNEKRKRELDHSKKVAPPKAPPSKSKIPKKK